MKILLILFGILIILEILNVFDKTIIKDYKIYSKDKDYCKNKNDGLIKDVCYLTLTIENLDVSRFPIENCRQIENTYLQYMCLRLEIRPHMQDFITKKTDNLSFDNFLYECSDYDDYHRIFCTYLHAIKIGKTNITEGQKICESLEDIKLVGECKFLMTFPFIMEFNKDTDKKIDFLMEFCEGISHVPFRAECYYIIADELALMKNPKYLKDISNACTESFKAIDYSCFNHVTYLMSEDMINEFCEIVEPIGKAECYRGLGEAAVLSLYNNLTRVMEKCKNIPDEFRYHCYFGIGSSIGVAYPENVSFGIKMCGILENELKDYCLDGFGNVIGHYYGHNVDLAIKRCNLFEKEYRETCYNGIADSIGFTNFYQGIEECNKFPEEYKDNCFHGLSHSIGFYHSYDIMSGIIKCNKIPYEFRSICFNGLGHSVGIGENINLEIEKCYLVPEEFVGDCIEGIANSIGHKLSYNISLGIEKCNLFPQKQKANCFHGLADGITYANFSQGIGLCDMFPKEYKEDCFYSLINIIGFYNNNAFMIEEQCNNVPKAFKDICIVV